MPSTRQGRCGRNSLCRRVPARRAAKRIFGIPDFRYYALADGIREILSRTDR